MGYVCVFVFLGIGIFHTGGVLSQSVLDPALAFVASINARGKAFTTDNLGNIYLIGGNVLEKYSPEGRPLKTFTQKTAGNITFVDVSDPLKILVFYRDVQQIVILDNFLSIRSTPISLEALGFRNISLVCTSREGGFWMFDTQNKELIRIQNNLTPAVQSGNLIQQTGVPIQPIFMLEYQNSVYLCDTTHGILVFDRYGTYHKTLPCKPVTQFQIQGEKIIYYVPAEKKMKSYNMRTLEMSEMVFAMNMDKKIIDARTEKEKLYLLTEKMINIYYVKNEK